MWNNEHTWCADMTRDMFKNDTKGSATDSEASTNKYIIFVVLSSAHHNVLLHEATGPSQERQEHANKQSKNNNKGAPGGRGGGITHADPWPLSYWDFVAKNEHPQENNQNSTQTKSVCGQRAHGSDGQQDAVPAGSLARVRALSRREREKRIGVNVTTQHTTHTSSGI